MFYKQLFIFSCYYINSFPTFPIIQRPGDECDEMDINITP